MNKTTYFSKRFPFRKSLGTVPLTQIYTAELFTHFYVGSARLLKHEIPNSPEYDVNYIIAMMTYPGHDTI